MSSLMQLSKELPFSTSQGMILQSFSTNIKISPILPCCQNHRVRVETPEVPLIACKMQLPSPTYVRWGCDWHFPDCGWDLLLLLPFVCSRIQWGMQNFKKKNQEGIQIVSNDTTYIHTDLQGFSSTPSWVLRVWFLISIPQLFYHSIWNLPRCFWKEVFS